ncbi:sensor histidine kinase [Acuticoccus sp. M5D2P5]|uniref:sensor histidine kinase n=1 Tax=Acuticoccus kalidii TaxID=2910977 RepID=UPI001F4844C5|nr:sensor histidine kinase [Acuticoccus kalidii]MCF3932692.1 sensor histidine kinase [Acuticoccus kalidii]
MDDTATATPKWMLAVTRDDEPRFDNDLTAEALKKLDVGALIVGRAGEIAFANDSARRDFGCAAPGGHGQGDFVSLWADGEATVWEAMAEIAAASSWHPFALTPIAGNGAGTPIPLHGQAIRIRTSEANVIYLLIVQDDERGARATENRQLVGRLTEELEKGARTEQTLKDLLAQQANLNRELVHRSKNNLALLVSLLRATRREAKEAVVDEAMTEFERRLISVAAIHDVLDGNQQTESVRADQLIDRICDSVAASLAPPNVSLSRALEPTELLVAEATPLGLIVNEFVTNALKHAFPGGRQGTVLVSLRHLEDGRIEAVVSDDGTGRDAEPAPRQSGPAPIGGSGLGIVGALIKQLDAETTRTVADGTICRLVFRPAAGLG